MIIKKTKHIRSGYFYIHTHFDNKSNIIGYDHSVGQINGWLVGCFWFIPMCLLLSYCYTNEAKQSKRKKNKIRSIDSWIPEMKSDAFHFFLNFSMFHGPYCGIKWMTIFSGCCLGVFLCCCSVNVLDLWWWSQGSQWWKKIKRIENTEYIWLFFFLLLFRLSFIFIFYLYFDSIHSSKLKWILCGLVYLFRFFGIHISVYKKKYFKSPQQ